jgi:hypothetical protein
MTPRALANLVRVYQERLGDEVQIFSEQTSPTRHPADQQSYQMGAQLSHALWMLGELAGMAERLEPWAIRDGERAQRWLGFVQGVLWAQGVYSIDELRAHVKEADGGG